MKYVSYIRVSTDKQGDSKLGVEAQRRINNNFIQSVSGISAKEAIEIETGTNKFRISIKHNLNLETLLKKRPILKELIEFCQKEKATLVVKDLSRLGRNQLLISYLMQAGINFVCADSPNDAAFILQIKAALAEEEARLISKRTIEALQSKKARGAKLGTPNPENLILGRQIQAKKRIEEAKIFYKNQTKRILKLREKGFSYKEIAQQLNEFGIKTREGREFYAMTIKRIIDREKVKV
ncbi:MAG: recombinase family protein [Candidatus Caenarcaniphilales bacterium]|nr:recombinase family protein [Candidatus Caenarcaniphilales bacterium]